MTEKAAAMKTADTVVALSLKAGKPEGKNYLYNKYNFVRRFKLFGVRSIHQSCRRGKQNLARNN